jgi:hypothetical protein
MSVGCVTFAGPLEANGSELEHAKDFFNPCSSRVNETVQATLEFGTPSA